MSTSILDLFKRSLQRPQHDDLFDKCHKAIPDDMSAQYVCKTNELDFLANNSIRLLLLTENQSGVHNTLFDSNTYLLNHQSTATLRFSAPQFGHHISSKLNNQMLTQMIFGSVPMVVSNRNAIKVHSMR
jgi:hypothetical protein